MGEVRRVQEDVPNVVPLLGEDLVVVHRAEVTRGDRAEDDGRRRAVVVQVGEVFVDLDLVERLSFVSHHLPLR
jgi:hypothetical protein